MLLSIKQVIERLGICRNTLTNMRARGDFIPAHKISEGRIGFDLDDLEDWLVQRTIP